MREVFIAATPEEIEQKECGACYGHHRQQRLGIVVRRGALSRAWRCITCGCVNYDEADNVLGPIVDLLEEIRGLLNV